jgi:hypothetical protein
MTAVVPVGCFTCRAPAPAFRCAHCQTATYCGATCQREGWAAGHGIVCGHFARVARAPSLFASAGSSLFLGGDDSDSDADDAADAQRGRKRERDAAAGDDDGRISKVPRFDTDDAVERASEAATAEAARALMLYDIPVEIIVIIIKRLPLASLLSYLTANLAHRKELTKQPTFWSVLFLCAVDEWKAVVRAILQMRRSKLALPQPSYEDCVISLATATVEDIDLRNSRLTEAMLPSCRFPLSNLTAGSVPRLEVVDNNRPLPPPSIPGVRGGVVVVNQGVVPGLLQPGGRVLIVNNGPAAAASPTLELGNKSEAWARLTRNQAPLEESKSALQQLTKLTIVWPAERIGNMLYTCLIRYKNEMPNIRLPARAIAEVRMRITTPQRGLTLSLVITVTADLYPTLLLLNAEAQDSANEFAEAMIPTQEGCSRTIEAYLKSFAFLPAMPVGSSAQVIGSTMFGAWAEFRRAYRKKESFYMERQCKEFVAAYLEHVDHRGLWTMVIEHRTAPVTDPGNLWPSRTLAIRVWPEIQSAVFHPIVPQDDNTKAAEAAALSKLQTPEMLLVYKLLEANTVERIKAVDKVDTGKIWEEIVPPPKKETKEPAAAPAPDAAPQPVPGRARIIVPVGQS